MKWEAEQPFVSNEVNQSHEDNKVDFELPPIFDDYGKDGKEEEEVLLADSEKDVVADQEETKEGNTVNFDVPPKFDEYEVEQ